MKILRLFMFCLLLSSVGLAQQTFTDSMRVIIFGQFSDSVRIRALNRLSVYYLTNNLDSAVHYGNMMMNIAEKTRNKRLLFRALIFQSDIAGKKNNLAEQLTILTKCLDAAEKAGDSILIARINNHLCGAYMNANDLSGAKDIVSKNISFLRSQNLKERKPMLRSAYFTMGKILLADQDFKKALEYFKLVQGMPDHKDKNLYFQARLNKELGSVYAGLKDGKKAVAHFEKAITLNKHMNNLDELAACEQSLAEYLLKDKSDTVLESIRYAEIIANRANNKNSLLNLYDQYIQFYDTKGDFKRKSQYQELKQKLKDSLNLLAFSKALADAKIKFSTQQKEKENLLLNQKNSMLESKVMNTRRSLIMTVVLAMAILFILFFLYRISKLSQEKKNMELEHKLFRSQINPHFIFNSISSIQSFVLAEDRIKSAKHLATFSKLMRTIFENSRREYILFEEEINSLKLYLILEQIRSNNRLHFNFETNGLDTQRIFIPPMIIQPHVENAIKHGLKNLTAGESGMIKISFLLNEGELFCTIDDNGIGIEKAKELEFGRLRKSSGIEITTNRLKYLCKNLGLKYKFSIRDKGGTDEQTKGTIVTFILPFKNSYAPNIGIS